MTAADIQRRLIYERYRRNFCLPNYTPSGWWECDVFEITKAGYFREYEIKLSRSDFKADAKKERSAWQWDPATRRIVYPAGPNKHKELSVRSLKGPTQFWFVCPKNLLAVEEVPEWAGLIYCGERNGYEGYAPAQRIFVELAKDAPALHREKIKPEIKKHAQSVTYWRFLNHWCWQGKPQVEVVD